MCPCPSADLHADPSNYHDSHMSTHDNHLATGVDLSEAPASSGAESPSEVDYAHAYPGPYPPSYYPQTHLSHPAYSGHQFEYGAGTGQYDSFT